MNTPPQLAEIIEMLADVSTQHARTSATYRLLEKVCDQALAQCSFRNAENARQSLGMFGELAFPYQKLGNVDSLALLGLDELMLFAFYLRNRSRYSKAADIGANIGLHTILMAKLGWNVTAYEPDPFHAAILERNLQLNGIDHATLVKAAVSDKKGEMEFVRVLGNTTSSHLAGAKAHPYGKLERFPVAVHSIKQIMPCVDFIKVDAEGQEGTIILGTDASDWVNTDMVLEVGSPENAQAIYNHLPALKINAFAQKIGWARVEKSTDIPTSYKEGSLFLSRHATMPWQNT